MLWYSLISFLVAILSVFFIRRYFRLHAQRYPEDAPQRFHHGAVPRLGRPGIFMGWIAGVLVAVFFDQGLAKVPNLWLTYGSIIAVVLAVVAIGALEDLTQKVTPRWRLVLTAVTACVAVYVLNLTVPHLNVPFLDLYWKQWPVLGILLTLLGLIGLTHAFNLIDGYNGLAGLVAILIALSYAYVTFKLGDRELFIMAVCLVAATLGFLMLNYPRGLIFAGDGGAYFWGFTLALIGILLVQRHPQVSPWYPLLLLIHPIRKPLRMLASGIFLANSIEKLVYGFSARLPSTQVTNKFDHSSGLLKA